MTFTKRVSVGEIGKVYGHLANEHRKAMTKQLKFGPAVLKKLSI